VALSELAQGAMFFAAALPAIVFHEVAHGWVSNLLGDPTAKQAGRLSFNPLRHIDPIGTLLLPALLIMANFPAFGYAKPVPINPHFYKDYRWGMLLTGLAGPATNLVFAVVAGGLFRLGMLVPETAGAPGIAFSLLVTYLFFLAQVNLVLMFFNLIPIPPFDGSRIIPVFLSDGGMRVYAQLERYGFVIIFAILWLGRGVVGAYFSYTVTPLLRLVTGLSG
jgi:Zn-dependent protease